MSEIATGPSLWEQCLSQLAEHSEIPANEFNTWIRPLQSKVTDDHLILYAPNQFVESWVRDKLLGKLSSIINQLSPEAPLRVILTVGGLEQPTNTPPTKNNSKQLGTHNTKQQPYARAAQNKISFGGVDGEATGNLNSNFRFDNFVEGNSNRLALAATRQIAQNPGQSYNPLFLYGGVGLGKTHLMQSLGNLIKNENPSARVIYLHSERFVADMIKALQRNEMDQFKKFYRTVNCLLIDDIQFFANKERSQEEFFHTFNYLLDGRQQIVLTCDRYPKEINGLEERLQSRFGWGLTVAVEPPELETRVAILKSKAEQMHTLLPDDVAFFIAKHIQSNVRELEGALKRVLANAQFTEQNITVGLAREALKDLLAIQAKLVTIDNIQRTVAEYYKIKTSDLTSKRRSRSVARPRQIAMLLAKELTGHSLPEIGEAFGGRDHTTVLHACRKMKELLSSTLGIQEDHKNLLRILSA